MGIGTYTHGHNWYDKYGRQPTIHMSRALGCPILEHTVLYQNTEQDSAHAFSNWGLHRAFRGSAKADTLGVRPVGIHMRPPKTSTTSFVRNKNPQTWTVLCVHGLSSSISFRESTKYDTKLPLQRCIYNQGPRCIRLRSLPVFCFL